VLLHGRGVLLRQSRPRLRIRHSARTLPVMNEPAERSTTEAVERREGHEVEIAPTGSAGLAMAEGLRRDHPGRDAPGA
jgi:hypothetical protein